MQNKDVDQILEALQGKDMYILDKDSDEYFQISDVREDDDGDIIFEGVSQHSLHRAQADIIYLLNYCNKNLTKEQMRILRRIDKILEFNAGQV